MAAPVAPQGQLATFAEQLQPTAPSSAAACLAAARSSAAQNNSTRASSNARHSTSLHQYMYNTTSANSSAGPSRSILSGSSTSNSRTSRSHPDFVDDVVYDVDGAVLDLAGTRQGAGGDGRAAGCRVLLSACYAYKLPGLSESSSDRSRRTSEVGRGPGAESCAMQPGLSRLGAASIWCLPCIWHS